MLKKCHYCNKEYPEVSRYCPYCGSPNPTYKEKEEKKIDFKRQLLLFGVGFLGFQIIGTLIQLIFMLVGQGRYGSDKNAIVSYLTSAPVSMFVNSITYCLIFTLLLFIAMPSVKNLLKSFTKSKAYLGAIFAFAFIYAFNILYSVILDVTGVSVASNNNQSSLDSLIKIYPLFSLIVFGFLGPVCEELTYRVGLFDFLKRKNRIFAYILTIVIFTLIHFDFAADNIINELINIPYYASAAFAFTFVYDRFGFAASATAHVVNNLFSCISSLI